MPEVKDVFRVATQDVRPDPGFVDRHHDHWRRKNRRRRIGSFVAVAAIGALFAVLVFRALSDERQRQPAGLSPAPSVSVPLGQEGGSVIDLLTGEMTPLARSIIGSQYAATLDGSRLAFVRTSDEGSPQIFIADIDGTGARQVTHDPVGASSPAWSPDGTSIAYVSGSQNASYLLVLKIATGKAKQVTNQPGPVWGPSFTPDGSSLIYTDWGPASDAAGTASDAAEMRIQPIAGGPSTILFGGGQFDGHGGMGHAGGGSMSPDGSLVAMTGNEIGGPGAALFVSNVDGTQRQAIPAYGTSPAGAWSPDGSRILGLSYGGHRIIIVDVATGNVTSVANGSDAIWLDDHSLLVEA